MRYVILGAGGMLGADLRLALTGHDVFAAGRDIADLESPASLAAVVAGADVVINAAAYTDVDGAETDRGRAFAVNAAGAGAAAAAAATAGARFVQISTDYVFDGTASEPYDEGAPTAPRSVYGESKAEGERLVLAAHPAPFIVRTAWLYGAAGRNFPHAVLARAAEQETIDVVTDQRGQPTWARDVATAVRTLIDGAAPAGIYHATNAGEATWFDFARAVFGAAGLDPERVRPSWGANPRPAARPAYSVLGHGAWRRAGLPAPRPWRDALADAARSGVLAAR